MVYHMFLVCKRFSSCLRRAKHSLPYTVDQLIDHYRIEKGLTYHLAVVICVVDRDGQLVGADLGACNSCYKLNNIAKNPNKTHLNPPYSKLQAQMMPY